MAEPRKLKFTTEADAIAEIERLCDGYLKAGQWNLQQICFHCNVPVGQTQLEQTSSQPTPDQKRAQEFLEKIVAAGEWPSGKMSPPPPMVPPDYVSPAEIDTFIQSLKKLGAYRGATSTMFFFGPIDTEKMRRFFLIHAAHHMGFLAPTVGRRVGLRFESEQDVMADVKKLAKGYRSSGNWNLYQTCWHLAKATEFGMRPGPFPEPTPEQIARRPMLDAVLQTGKLPSGLQAPEQFHPPADAGPGEIDHLATALEAALVYPGPFAPHRIFGKLTPAEAHTLRMHHCAHHLSHLIPTQES